MAQSPLAIANAPGARRGVVVYRPAAQRPVAPTKRTTPTRRATQGGTTAPGAYQRIMSTKASQEKQQKEAQKQAEDQAYEESPWYKKGLGMVLGNPVVSNVLKPLGVLGTAGRAVTYGVEQLAEATEDLPTWTKFMGPPGNILAGLDALVDSERTRKDDRGFYEKVIKPTSDYGFGQLLDPDMSPWLSRPIGFLGDVGLDPTTYLTGGATRVAGAVAKGAKVAEAASAASKLDDALKLAARAAESGNFDEVARASRLAAESDALARRLGAEAEAISLRKVPLRQGRKARAQLQGELAQYNPDLLEKYGAEIARGGERGFNTITDPAIREAIGLNAPGMRFMGVPIPKTEGITRRGAQLGGAARAGINKVPAIRTATNKLVAPRGLEEAIGTLTQGAGGDVLRAATATRIQNLMRQGAGNFEGRGNKALTDLTRQLRDVGGEEEIRTLFRQAEADPSKNVLNDFFGEKLPALYQEVTGRKMDVARDPATYVPHMLNPDGKRFLQSLEDSDKVTKAMGFQKDDLLEGSHYLEKSRKLEPKVVGEPTDFDIAGRTITLTDGTVDELNEQFARAFPEFKGKMYMDDPVRIGEAYVSSVARQAGRDLALDAMADSANPLVREVSGELLEAVETRNKFLRQNPFIEKIREGYTKGQRLVPIKGKGDMPETPFDDMLATTRHREATKEARTAVIKEGRTFVDAVKEDVSASRGSMVDTLKGLRSLLGTGLKKRVKELDTAVLGINAHLGRMDAEIQKLGPLVSQNVEETVALSSTVRAEIATVKGEIKKIQDRYGKKIPRDLKRAHDELNKALSTLESQERRVHTEYAKGTQKLRDEVDLRRAALERPVEEARKELDRVEAQAEKKIGPRVSPERVKAANVELRQDFITEDAFEAERELLHAEMRKMRAEGKPLHYRIDGSLTPESTAEVQAAVAKTKAEQAAAAPKPRADRPLSNIEPVSTTPRPKKRGKGKAEPITVLDRGEWKQIFEAGEGTGVFEQKGWQLRRDGDRYAIVAPDGEVVRRVEDWHVAQQVAAKMAETRPLAAAPAYPAGTSLTDITKGELNPEFIPAAEPPPVPGAAAAGPTPEQYAEGRDVMSNALLDIVDEENLDQVDAIYTLSDRDTAQLVGEMWDSLPPGAQQRLQELGFTPGAAPEQLALPPAAAAEAGGAAVPAAPVVPPAPLVAPTDATKLVKSGGNVWNTGDGFTLTKNNNNSWHLARGEQDFGIFKTKKEATDHLEFMQEIMGEELEKLGLAEPTATRVAAEVPEPGPTVVEPPVQEPPVPVPEAPKKPTGQRLRYKWKQEVRAHNKVEVGPEDWEVIPYEPVLPRSQWPEGTEAVRGQPTTGKARYVASSATDDGLSGQTFASAREAKLAVQDHILKRDYVADAVERKAAYDKRIAEIRDYKASPEPTPAFAGGPRTVERPVVPPEEAAANRARAAGVQRAPGSMQPVEPPAVQGPLQPSPEAIRLAEMDPGRQAMVSEAPGHAAWLQDYNDWQEALARLRDPNTMPVERPMLEKRARTLGAQFTQKNGKHYNKNAAQKLMIADIDWQMKLDADPDVIKARLKHEQAVTQADRQIEAMVYTKYNNPITGTEEYTRLPAGSMKGFLDEEDVTERVAVPIEAPKQGDATLPSIRNARDPWDTGYTPGQRAEEREIIEAGHNFVLGPHAIEYDEMRIKAEGLTERLDASAANETELARLEAASKDAYSQGVEEVDQAVKEASLAEYRAKQNMDPKNFVEGRRPPPDAQAVYDQAKRTADEARARQTDVRQAWMEADRAYKAKLAERDEYLKVKAEVSSAENAIFSASPGGAWDSVDSKGRPTKGIIDEVRRGETPRPGGYDLDEDTAKLVTRLQQADVKLDAYDGAGRSWMTPAERRDAAGQLVAIDKTMRDLLNQRSEGVVKHAEAILPGKEPPIPQNPENVRVGKYSTRTSVPPVRGTGQDDLTRRAYAESYDVTEPSETSRMVTTEETRARPDKVFGGDEEVLVERPQAEPRQAYNPITERERLAQMEHQAQRSDALNEPLQEELSNIEVERGQAQGTFEEAKQAVDALSVERDEKLLPFRDRAQTLKNVDEALNDKARIITKRNAAVADAEAAKKVTPTGRIGKRADLIRIADEIEAVARSNPDLLDKDLAIYEGVLHDLREEAKRVNEADLTWKQVQTLIDKVSQKGDHTVDVMLTTVGKNWKMLYEASGDNRAFLQAGDTILQTDLHRMFQNLYEIKKDPVWLGRTLNAFTNLFKTYATLSPGFHVRNALSAIFMNATDGVALRTQYHAAGFWRDYAKAPDGEAWLKALPDGPSQYGFTGQQIKDAFWVANSTGAGGRFTEAGFAEVMDSGRFLNRLEKLQRNRFTRLSQRAGQRVEGSVRLGMALDSMVKGEDIESAIQRVNRIHFDYSEVSRWDENMKRIVPFWTFMSRNMPMQVSQMWTHPKVYLGYERFVKNFSAENEEYTPEYWTKAGAWNTGLKVPGFIPESLGGGLPIIASPDLGFTRLAADLKDYEDFLSWKRPGAVLSQGNPILTAPAEGAFRTDIFTGQRFEEGETVPVGGINSPYKWLAGALGQTEGGEVDASFMNMIRAVNPLTDRSTRLAPSLTGGDEEGKKRMLESWLRFGGAPLRTLTPKQQDNEYFRRYYDQLDAEKQRRDREERKAG